MNPTDKFEQIQIYKRLNPVEQEAMVLKHEQEIKDIAKQQVQDGDCKKCKDGCPACDARRLPIYTTPPQRTEQEREACERCKQLEEQAYDLVGELRVANIKLSMRPQRTWVGLTDEDCKGMSAGDKVVAMWANRTLKEKNNV